MKKNFNKIPRFIKIKLSKTSSEKFIVAVVVKVPESIIRKDRYKHLGVGFESDQLKVPEIEILPPVEQGRFSRLNIEGKEVILKNLPMVSKTYTAEVPNWGDWYNGSHTINWSRDVYRRGFIHPRHNTIKCELLGQEFRNEKVYVIKFEVVELLNRDSENFDENLFFNLNLLQENVGSVNLFVSDASYVEFLKSVYVSWEILPMGQRDENIRKIITGLGRKGQDLAGVVEERYDFFEGLLPKSLVYGKSGFERYMGALLEENLVIFENFNYGNAVYIMYENWKDLSKRTRLDLLKAKADGFNRIVHSTDWKKKVKTIVNGRRKLIKRK